MRVDGKDIRTIWLDENDSVVKIIDQRKLPHELIIVDLKTVDDAMSILFAEPGAAPIDPDEINGAVTERVRALHQIWMAASRERRDRETPE